MKYIKTGILLCALFALFHLNLSAQDAVKIDIKAVVVDMQGVPVAGAIIFNEKDNSSVYTTDGMGNFSMSATQNELLTIEAEGYVTQIVVAKPDLKKIILTKNNNEEIQVAFTKVDKKDLLGGISYLDVPELMEKNYYTYSLDNLSAYINGYHGNIWGNDNYLVLVDGIPRDATNVVPTEIDQITVLKGASAVALYGSRGAKGVVYITTKRGSSDANDIKVRLNSGMYVPKSYPEYLGSAEYMTLYNEALANDGLAAKYSAEDIYNYSTGSNPYRYPNVDYYSSEYLKKVYNRSDATLEITGGNERTHYYTNMGFQYANSLLNVGQAKQDNTMRFNLRGNVDVKINDFITSKVDANATFYNSRNAFGNYWSNAATLRPNRFAPLIPIDYVEGSDEASWVLINNSANVIDGKYILGGTQLDQTNPFADMYAGGYNKYTNRQFQFDVDIDFDMSKVLKGLSFSSKMGIDYSTSYNQSYNNTYATYQPTWNNYSGSDLITSLTKYNEDQKSGTQNVSGSWQRQTLYFSGQFDYNNTFNKVHNVSAILLAYGFQQAESAVYHRTSNANLGLQASYNYMHKYYADFTGAVIHSAKLAPGHREAFSPTVSFAWDITKEKFMPKSDFLSSLKLTASAGIINTDLDISSYYMYEGIYTQSSDAGATWWGWKEGVSLLSVNSIRGANENLTFAKREEVNLGFEASLFKNSVTIQGSYFNSLMNGLVTQASNVFPSYLYTYYPTTSFIPYINYNNDKRTGFDLAINYNTKIDKVDLSLGVVGTYYETKATQRSENYEYDYQTRVGKPLDGIWGLQSEGFFQDDNDIATHETQSFGDVKPGDIKYKDQNGDGVIDSQDQVYLGRGGWYGSPYTVGVNFTVKWKNFSLFALGTGGFGSYGIKNNSYWWVYGDGKYSAVVRNRWTEATKETATYPRLTTLSGDNNFQTSDFWLYKNDRFNVAKVQLSYYIPSEMLNGSFIKGIELYVSGSDLLTISKEKEYMEMNVGSSPQSRFYNFGVKAVF